MTYLLNVEGCDVSAQSVKAAAVCGMKRESVCQWLLIMSSC